MPQKDYQVISLWEGGIFREGEAPAKPFFALRADFPHLGSAGASPSHRDCKQNTPIADWIALLGIMRLNS